MFIFGAGLVVGITLIGAGLVWHRAVLQPSREPLRPGAAAQLSYSLWLVILGVVVVVGSFVLQVVVLL